MARTKQGVATREARHTKLGLTDDQAVRMYHTMVRARMLDERMWLMQRMGKAAFVITGQGHEGCQVASASALRPGHDWMHPYYRDLAAAMTWGMTARHMMLAVLAKQESPESGGRQMPGHYGNRDLHIITGSSPVGTQIAQAVGVALASKLKGNDEVTITYFGEGASCTGDAHGGMNFAAVFNVPIVFFLENNQYAITVPEKWQYHVKDLSVRAEGYGFPGYTIDGNDVLKVYEVTQDAVERARAGKGPTLIEAKTYRFTPHSSEDAQRRYRSDEEIAEWREHRDPIKLYGAYLREAGIWDDEKEAEFRDQVKSEVDDATEYAERASWPDPSTLYDHVYKTRSTTL